ncbi:MAG: efflux RND transporter permease subunit [Gammaproteobacteria bacterium]|nr:MFS transporter [Gammaproteobacteria bacterium]
MHKLIEVCVTCSRPVLLVLATLLVAGLAAYFAIPKESEPDVAIPIIYVNLTHEGISPEDAERLLLRPMETELRNLEGLREMRGTATEGSAVLILEFDAGFDADQALLDVREKVDTAKAELPEDTDEPFVQEVNIALFPVLVVNLHGNVPERTLMTIARDLRDELEGLPGVLDAEIVGSREELLEVIVDPVKLESYGLSYEEIFNFVSRNNRLVAAGALDTGAGRFAVKVPGVFENLEDVLSLPIKTDGLRTVTFSDVATVRRTYKDAESFARLNGERSVSLEISKRIGANIVEVVDSVKRKVAEEQASWPPTVKVTFTQDSSEDVRTMLADLQNNVLTAVLLVMIVILAALGPRSSALVGLAIPGAFLGGILAIWLIGYSMNIVVLFSLIMAVGMLVDASIIVVELADRYLAQGYGRVEAYMRAAQRMSWPVTSSTATTLAVFLPLLFWPGIVGEFMKYLPVTLLVTLTGSLLMALIFVPTVGALVGPRGNGTRSTSKGDSDAHLLLVENPFESLSAVGRGYIGVLRRLIEHPGKVLLAGTAFLVGVYAAYAAFGRGFEFFPSVEPTQAAIKIRARGDLSVAERDALVREVEQRILGMPEIESVYSRTSVRFGSEDEEDLIGRIQLRYVDWKLRRPSAEILREIRERTADIAGIVIETEEQDTGLTQGKPIQIEISSRRPELLPEAVAKIRAHLDRMPGLIDITDSRPIPGIEWRLSVDRAEAARFGADITTVGNAIQLVTNGILIGDYRPHDADDEVDIRVRFPAADRNLDRLDELRVQTANGLVPVSTFVKRTPAPRVGNLQRVDGRRVMTISADVEEDVLPDTMVREISAWLETADLPPEVDVVFKGENEDQEEAAAFLTNAFIAALFLMAIILVTQFNSFYQAALVMTAVVFSTVGVLLGLLVTNRPFGIVMSGIGVIALAGIVVNNNIVLIDTYNMIRAQGKTAVDAVLETCAQRFRPVMLTTITTILGLMPMVLGVNVDLIGRNIDIGGPSTQWWTQLSTAIAGGLAFATVLTLVLTPAMLVLGDRVSRALRKSPGQEEAHAPAAPVPESA